MLIKILLVEIVFCQPIKLNMWITEKNKENNHVDRITIMFVQESETDVCKQFIKIHLLNFIALNESKKKQTILLV